MPWRTRRVEPHVHAVGRIVGDELLGQAIQPFGLDRDERLDQHVTRGEVPIQRADADAGTAGDLVERGVDAVLLERLVGDLEQSLAIALRVGTERPGCILGEHGLHKRRMSPYIRRDPPNIPKEHTMDTTNEKDAAIFEQQPGVRQLNTDERLSHLAARTNGVLATVNANGFPHMSTVIYTWDADAQVIRVSTRAHRAKARNATRDHHAALFVEGPDMWSFVVAEGEIEVSPISTELGDATGRELLGIFPQPDAAAEAAFLAQQVDERRVVLRLHPQRIYGDIIELDPPQ